MIEHLKLNSSPVQIIEFNQLKFYIKRDDLLEQYFSGNKARKLHYFLEKDFPQIKRMISYGSVQSNSLLSMAALAELKNWQLEFYVHNIPKWLYDKPIGNYAQALKFGVKVIPWSSEDKNNVFSSVNDFIENKTKDLLEDTLFIPEGGHCEQAQFGIKKLASEIESYCTKEKIEQLLIMLPSGTGTTALFLNSFLRHLDLELSVFTCACVGDDNYLKKQFNKLSNNLKDWPTILPINKPSSKRKYHFGKLYKEHYELWLDLKHQTSIEFDLLYDPIGWRCLLDYLEESPQKNVLYIHQGGLIGNESMLARYKRKLCISEDTA
ncbi:MAG: 1-aminocyclopropane-1-carboxylate deaminase [Polaribacter sp.]|jgi:1-aminocyclopropane-1-carboxylate deaminase